MIKEELINNALVLRPNNISWEFNNSYFFLLPLCGLEEIKNNSSKIQVFMHDQERNSDLVNCIYIVTEYNNLNTVSNERLKKFLVSKNNYKYDYYLGYGEKDMVVYVIECLPEFVRDYNLIVNGNYSKISEEAYNKIIAFGHDVQDTKKLKGIIKKENWYKESWEETLNVTIGDQELYSAFNPEKEIFQYI